MTAHLIIWKKCIKPGYIYKEKHHIAIDWGCNGWLAAICLETGQELYAENLENSYEKKSISRRVRNTT